MLVGGKGKEKPRSHGLRGFSFPFPPNGDDVDPLGATSGPEHLPQLYEQLRKMDINSIQGNTNYHVGATPSGQSSILAATQTVINDLKTITNLPAGSKEGPHDMEQLSRDLTNLASTIGFGSNPPETIGMVMGMLSDPNLSMIFNVILAPFTGQSYKGEAPLFTLPTDPSVIPNMTSFCNSISIFLSKFQTEEASSPVTITLVPGETNPPPQCPAMPELLDWIKNGLTDPSNTNVKYDFYQTFSFPHTESNSLSLIAYMIASYYPDNVNLQAAAKDAEKGNGASTAAYNNTVTTQSQWEAFADTLPDQ